MGTMHIPALHILDDIKGLQFALNSSEAIVTEMAASIRTEETRKKYSYLLYLPDSISYSGLLSEEEYETLDSALKSILSKGLDELGNLNPSTLYSRVCGTMLYEIEPKLLNYDKSIDTYIQEFGKEMGMPLLGLESPEDMVSYENRAMSTEEYAKFLVQSLRSPDKIKETRTKMYESYRAGDMTALYNTVFINPDYGNDLISESEMNINKIRNDKWIAQLPALMEKHSCFIAVGGAHLGGKDGLINQLRELNYKVEPVK